MISGVLTALLVLAASSQPQGSPELIDLLQRATEYVTQYEAELGNLIGSEEYLQNAVWLAPSQRGGPMVAKRLQRRVSSDFLIIQVGPEWAALRKANRVVGSKVKEPEPSFEDAFDDSPDANQKRLNAMKGESTRYNIGDIIRETNLPTMALKVLRKGDVSHFAFERVGSSKIEGIQTQAVRFREQTSPTLVIGGNGEFLYSNGTIWIEPETGRVLRTEFNVENRYAASPIKARIVVTYTAGKNLNVLVPTIMEEHYESEFNNVDCKAYYSNFRPFEVDVNLRFTRRFSEGTRPSPARSSSDRDHRRTDHVRSLLNPAILHGRRGPLVARISHELRFELAADCADYADGALACSGRLNGLCARHPRNPRNPRLLKSFDKNP